MLPDDLAAMVHAAGPREPGPRLRLKLLGTMAIADQDGNSLLPRGRKTRALAALLAIAIPRPLLRDQLAALLWSQRGREQARASLRQALHELHQSLGPCASDVLRVERAHLRFNPAHVLTDVQALSRATPDDPKALDLLDGPLLDDLNGLDPGLDRWLVEERRAVVQRAVVLAEAVLARQPDPAGTAAAAEQLLRIERTHEGAWRALIQAHLARDDRFLARDAYDRCSAVLAEAAVAPSVELNALLARIRGRPLPRSVQPSIGARSEPQSIRLGVMPFRSLDPRVPEELGIGLAEEITTALSRFRGLSLISSISLATLSGESLRESPRWQTVDVDALLDGTVQRSANRVRVMVRLLDVRDGGEIAWARRFDRPSGDLLTLQDEIAAETAAQVHPELLLREGRRAASHPPQDPKAHDLLLCAIPAMFRLDEAGIRAAGETLAAAATLDPNYAPVQAWWAYWHAFMVGQGWAEDPASAMRRAGELAERAVTLDPSDARGLSIAGHVRAFLHRDPAAAIQLHQQALSLNPCLPMAWVFSGMAHSYAGDHDEAIRRIAHARRLSPFDPLSSVFDMALMIPHLARGEYEMVVELGRRATALNPRLSSTQKGYLSALGHLGRVDEQAIVRERLLRLEPGFCVRDALARSPLLREQDRARYAEGLRRAGLPE